MAKSATLIQGRIVWAELADSNGFVKLRPAVIVSATEHLQRDQPIEVVAVTSRLPDELLEDHVLLPWHGQGHPRTGFNRRCAAVCSWLGRIMASDIQDVAGVVPGEPLLLILSKIAALQLPPPDSPKEP